MRDVETQTMSRHVPVSTQSEIRGFGRYIVYVDESGDHNLDKVDTNYPIFVLAFCVFDKKHYCEHVICELQRFKFRHMGHDLIGLHELDIRKEKGQFSGVFRSRQHKQVFLDELTDVIEKNRFVLICCVVDKRTLALTPGVADNPYHLALGACMQTLHEFLPEKKQHDALTHVVFEKRGKREDNELELEFRRQCDAANPWGISMPFDIVLQANR